MPEISVIMGVYNGEKTVDFAIESIVKQSFKDWEFIICDDCSTDQSYEHLLAWQQKDRRIRVIRNDSNMKLAATLNRCLSITDGNFVARMDDDDFSYQDRFETQLSFLKSHTEYDFVSSLVDCFDGQKIVKNRFWRKAEPQKKDFLSGTQFVHPATMFRTECLRNVGGYRVSPETIRTEDYDLFMRLYSVGNKGYNIQRPLLRYTINPTIMQKKRKYRYRVDEALVRYRGFCAMGLMPLGLIYVIRPLIIGLLPKQIIWKILYDKDNSITR